MRPTIRTATPADAHAISALIGGLAGFFFDDPAAEDSAAFWATIEPASVAEKIASANHDYLVAEDASGLCGVAAMRDGSHLYHLFVRADQHGKGLGGELWQQLRARSAATRFTVNASGYAVPFYVRRGFVPAGDPQVKDGLRFQPMVLELA